MSRKAQERPYFLLLFISQEHLVEFSYIRCQYLAQFSLHKEPMIKVKYSVSAVKTHSTSILHSAYNDVTTEFTTLQVRVGKATWVQQRCRYHC